MKWTIPAGASVSNSLWFGLEALVGAIAPAMEATTAALQIQAAVDATCNNFDDDSATFVDCTVAGTAAKIVVSTSAGKHDTLTNVVRGLRLRVKAVTSGDVAVVQSAAKEIEPMTIRL